jgi:DNA polymerase-3 subunit epsilon
MRHVVLDTETTGLEVAEGHRIIEVGCLELVNRRPARTFHHYLHPGRDIDPGAVEVHGITLEMLADKPRFAEIAGEFLEFIDGAELVIHNADFDVGFLNQELRLWDPSVGLIQDHCTVVDTLAMARSLHPGQRNSLDALCKRYGVDNSGREFHGALLDAQLLAEVYLAMTGGQAALLLEEEASGALAAETPVRRLDRTGLTLRVVRASPEELAAHEEHLALIDRQSGGKTLWRRYR